MILFLYLGGILSFLLLIVFFGIEAWLLKKTKYPKNKILDYMTERLLIKLVICCLITIVTIFGLPWILWSNSEKEITFIDKVESTELIYSFPEDDKIYANLINIRGNLKYEVVASTAENKLNFDKKVTKIVETKADEKPRYEKIGHYRKERIKKNGIIMNAVNDMYSSSIVSKDTTASDSKDDGFVLFDKGWKETFVEYDIIIYAPAKSIKE